MCIWFPSNPLIHDGGKDSGTVRFQPDNYFLFTAKTHRSATLRPETWVQTSEYKLCTSV